MSSAVSIITPSYQQAPFIERTLESVYRQRPHVIEHIVMDGGSTDGTIDILERWRDRITFTSGPDGGQTAALNAGLLQARGEIVGCLNSDDVYYDGAVAAALEAFERHPEADVIYGDADYIDAFDQVIGPYPTEDFSLERLKLICFLSHPAVFLRRRVIEQYGLFDTAFDNCMDYEYWLRIGMQGARFVHVPLRFAGSRVHPAAKTIRLKQIIHAEINDMLRARLGRIPDNWLSNYACTVLERRGVARAKSRAYRLRVALLAIGAAFRWNGFPSLTLLRTVASALRSR